MRKAKGAAAGRVIDARAAAAVARAKGSVKSSARAKHGETNDEVPANKNW